MSFEEYLILPQEQRLPLFQVVIADIEDDDTRNLYQGLVKTDKELIKHE